MVDVEMRNGCLWCMIADEVGNIGPCLLGHPPAPDDSLDYGHPAMLTAKEPEVHPLERGDDPAVPA